MRLTIVKVAEHSFRMVSSVAPFEKQNKQLSTYKLI